MSKQAAPQNPSNGSVNGHDNPDSFPNPAPSKPGLTKGENPLTESNEDRRRHLRTDLKLKARYLDQHGNEYPCVVVNISAGGALSRAKQAPKRGEKVILYIDGIGRFESTVIRAGKHAFAVRYNSRRAKTKRTADALIRVLNRGQRSVDRRLAPRIDMDHMVTLIQKDGAKSQCTILDISLTGASLGIIPQPPLGTEMTVGRMKARVVRRHDTGVGVVFLGASKHMEDIIEKTSTSQKTSASVKTSKSIKKNENINKSKNGIRLASSLGRKATE